VFLAIMTGSLVRSAGALCALALFVACNPLKKKEAPADTTGNSQERGAAAPPKPGCALPEDGKVLTRITVTKGCVVEVKDHLEIEDGGALILEPGVRIAFASNAYLGVNGGTLLAKGTEKDPIVFTSAGATKAPGDWAGLFFGAPVAAGTEISNARIEYAGAEAHNARAAVTIQTQTAGKRLTFTNVTFQNNAQAAVFAENDLATFAKFERNVMKNNKRSLVVPAAVLGSVGAGNVLSEPIETSGEVRESATWQAFGVPVYVKDHLIVGTQGNSPTLTLPAGLTLKFMGDSYLSVGESSGGSLIAPGVTFTSANETPHAGDWPGLFFYARTSNVNLEGATIEYAGRDAHSATAVLTFYLTPGKEIRGFKLNGLNIKEGRQAGMSTSDHDCGPYAAQLKVSGIPACRKE
jgi:hypothetical protein